MSYRIDLKDTSNTPVPTNIINSIIPGQVVALNEDGSAVVVLPDGSQRPTYEPAGSSELDSPWTRATLMDGFLVYRSAGQLVPEGPVVPGTPRAYKVIG